MSNFHVHEEPATCQITLINLIWTCLIQNQKIQVSNNIQNRDLACHCNAKQVENNKSICVQKWSQWFSTSFTQPSKIYISNIERWNNMSCQLRERFRQSHEIFVVAGLWANWIAAGQLCFSKFWMSNLVGDNLDCWNYVFGTMPW